MVGAREGRGMGGKGLLVLIVEGLVMPWGLLAAAADPGRGGKGRFMYNSAPGAWATAFLLTMLTGATYGAGATGCLLLAVTL